jgi:hypothetical protein
MFWWIIDFLLDRDWGELLVPAFLMVALVTLLVLVAK